MFHDDCDWNAIVFGLNERLNQLVPQGRRESGPGFKCAVAYWMLQRQK